jgi:Holliday junction resolvase
MNSRAKGKRGELEFAHFLKAHGMTARRGQQFKGGSDSPDVVCDDLADIHFEVKRVQAGNLYKWLEQACGDAAPGKIPIVAHRKNQKDWVAILPMTDLVRLLLLRAKLNAEAAE